MYETEVVSQTEKLLRGLAANRNLLNRLRQNGMDYARERLTWEAKAKSTTQVLNWVVRAGPKPDLPPPKMVYPKLASRS
jgi:hypothetical protein